ncbi:MAG: hypothetical protein NZM25_00790 [Leptospiraceae bacterium]|nr:hypothetical protein [Leptospiraceae bacterium]MDW8306262.1 hypothetical protein [Leptospiraceae bacterium]
MAGFKKWVIFLLSVKFLHAYTHETHKNLPEDAMLFMEIMGTVQMRWAADYLKAKAEGRYTGYCQDLYGSFDQVEYGHVENCSGPNENWKHFGAHGIARVGGIAPDFVNDFFWDDFTDFDWHFFIDWLEGTFGFRIFQNNYTSMQHFLNLLTANDNGNEIRTQNYNDYDGYGYNASFGHPDWGLDWGLAVLINNARGTIDLPGCTHPKCNEKYGIVPNNNPVWDYRQNGSTTPVGTPSTDKRIATSNGSNYNCYSDMAILNPCPDKGAKVGDLFQVPNTFPGGGSWLTGDEDWVIAEPGDNASTFYYNEAFLEGLTERNDSLQPARIVGRYYTLAPNQILWLGAVQHWTGDFNQPTHIWMTLGYNHGDYEGWTDENYGRRVIGDIHSPHNVEDFDWALAMMRGRQNRYNMPVGNIDKFLTEQAFFTYHLILRSGYNKMTTTDKNVWRRVMTWAVNSAIAEMAIIFEKGVMDLRKCRNSAACDNS